MKLTILATASAFVLALMLSVQSAQAATASSDRKSTMNASVGGTSFDKNQNKDDVKDCKDKDKRSKKNPPDDDGHGNGNNGHGNNDHDNGHGNGNDGHGNNDNGHGNGNGNNGKGH